MERTDFEQWKAKEVARLLALVETERRYYQEMVASLPIPLLVLSEDRSVLSANRAFRLSFSLRGEELRNKTIEQILPSEQLIEAIRDAHVHGTQRPEVFVEARGKQFRVAIVPIRNWDQDAEVETLLMVEDLTALDARRGIATIPSVAPTRAVLDVPAIVWQASTPGFAFTSVSGAGVGLFGYSLAHWRETAGFFAERLHPEDRETTLEFFRDAVKRGGDAAAEYRVLSASGQVMWCRETVRVPAPGAAVIAGVATDITRRRQLEAQFLTAQRAEALHHMAGRLAHDLNNPLMIVTGYGEEMLQSLAAKDPLRADVEQILTATGRISNLTGRLLHYTRRYVETPQPLNLSRTLWEMEGKIANTAGDGVAIDFLPLAAPVWGLADPAQFEEVMLALVSSARVDAQERTRISIACDFDFIAERSPQAALPPGRYARITVHDNGSGIESSAQTRVFESFLARESEVSAGPALARAYTIIRGWGGDLAFSSAPSQGSTFTILLPYYEAPVAEAHPQPPAKVPAEPVAVRPAAPEPEPADTILIVEDEAGIRALVRKILKREGYQVLEAGSAEEALSIASGHRGTIQLLLTDVMLPGMSGRELAEKLRAAMPKLKVLYVSGFTSDEDVVAARFPPGARFLQKPFTLNALVGKVRESLADQS